MRIEVADDCPDAMARFLFWLMRPLRRATRGPRQLGELPHDGFNTRLPVVLLPTIGHNRASLTFLRRFLTQRGWTHVWDVNHRAGRHTLADQAARDAWAFTLVFGLPIVFFASLLGAYVVQIRTVEPNDDLPDSEH